jgi:hypothetical protein
VAKLTNLTPVGLLGQGISPLQGRYLHTGKHKQNTHIYTSIPRCSCRVNISLGVLSLASFRTEVVYPIAFIVLFLEFEC